GVSGEPQLEISGLSWFYRGVDALVGAYRNERVNGFGDSGDCNVNVNCAEGANWQEKKQGVALIYIPAGMGGGFCSGSLVNNTANDGTPYFLTAYHCGANETNHDQWEFYFNFESPTCTDPAAEPDYDVIIGADKLAAGSDESGSDFLLLELLTTPPSGYEVYYNGWDLTESNMYSGVTIHHPSADVKKISTYTEHPVQATWSGAMVNAHLELNWSATTTGHGVTEGGSSGAPLFNANGLLVGTLTGGTSGCNTLDSPDYFGRFSYHWDMNGTEFENQLAPWLDPLNTGMTVCPPYPDSIGMVNAGFEISDTLIANGGSIMVTDTSEGNMYARHFYFPGGYPHTSAQAVQEVTYDESGYYDIILEINNLNDTSVYCAEDAIHVCCDEPELDVDFTVNSQYTIEGASLNFYNMSTGPIDSVHWYFSGAVPGESLDENPSGIVYPYFGDYSVSLCVYTPDTAYCYSKTDYIHVQENFYADSLSFYANDNLTYTGQEVNFYSYVNTSPMPDSIHWYFEGGTPEHAWAQDTSCYFSSAGHYDVSANFYFGNDSVEVYKDDYMNVCYSLILVDIDTCINGLQPADSVLANLTDTVANMIDLIYYSEQGEYTFVDSVPEIVNGNEYLLVVIVYCPGGKSQTQVFEARCVLETDEWVFTPVNEKKDVTIYPNPAGDHLFIQSETKPDFIQLFNVDGKMVYQEKSPGQFIDLSKLPSGMYMVKLEIENQDHQQKIIVN
ncbi:MAG: T9SS type A sorting domain-containing protein, partial [Bacteroidota bacterium]